MVLPACLGPLIYTTGKVSRARRILEVRCRSINFIILTQQVSANSILAYQLANINLSISGILTRGLLHNLSILRFVIPCSKAGQAAGRRLERVAQRSHLKCSWIISSSCLAISVFKSCFSSMGFWFDKMVTALYSLSKPLSGQLTSLTTIRSACFRCLFSSA